jgi:hypothetical protein
VIALQLRGPGYQGVIQESRQLSCAGEGGSDLKVRVVPIDHLLAENGPRSDVNGEHDKDLERVEAPEGRLGGVTWSYEGGELHKSTAAGLHVSEVRCGFILEHSLPRAENGSSQADGGRDGRERVK